LVYPSSVGTLRVCCVLAYPGTLLNGRASRYRRVLGYTCPCVGSIWLTRPYVEYRFGFSLSVSIVYYGMLSCFTSIDKTKGYDKVYDPCLAIYYK
jgi:hypothetical protein